MVRNIPQFLIAAPTSGSGKTTISYGLMALLASKGLKVQPFKCGPDYIDTKYHAAVCGRPSINLDTFMASKEHVRHLYARYAADADVCVVEGMMGMYDGYDRDRGSSADIARLLDIPVVLVVDAKSSAYSMAPLLSGFVNFNPDIRVAGVIFNKVGSLRHYEMLQEVCAELKITCLGCLPRQEALELEARHLGLDFSWIKRMRASTLADLLDEVIDWKQLLEMTTSSLPEKPVEQTAKPGKLRIAVASSEESFSFFYEEHLDILRRMGKVSFFNPEYNRPISKYTDLLYLPGGYPEQHAYELSRASRALDSIRNYIEAGGKVLAECGGMMYLSQAISYDIPAIYTRKCKAVNRMVGIFPFYVSFEEYDRKLSLGYRQFDYNGQHLRGHEFHYSQFGNTGVTYNEQFARYEGERHVEEEKNGLFSLPASVVQVCNAKGAPIDTPVFRYKNVIASYTHLYWGEIDVMSLF